MEIEKLVSHQSKTFEFCLQNGGVMKGLALDQLFCLLAQFVLTFAQLGPTGEGVEGNTEKLVSDRCEFLADLSIVVSIVAEDNPK